MLPRLSQVAVVKRSQCAEVANGILHPVWARNLKEFSPVYAGGIKKFFSAGKGLRIDQYSANIAQSFEIFVYEIANDGPQLMAMAVAMDSNRHLLKRLLERHVAASKTSPAMTRQP